MKLQILAIFAASLKGNKMNNMLRSIVYILFFLLFVTVEQDSYAQDTANSQTNTSCYQQQQDPCKKAVDFLFTNHFADIPQMAVSFDNPGASKFKCIARLLAALNEYKKQEKQTNNIDYHSIHLLHADVVDYYVYTLRRIII